LWIKLVNGIIRDYEQCSWNFRKLIIKDNYNYQVLITDCDYIKLKLTPGR